MTPGLARGPPFPSRATKGSVVAIASLEKPSVPLVVGVCEIDVASLREVKGAKGHAVRGEHWDGDAIWAWSHSGGVGGKAPDILEGWDNDDGTSGLEQRLSQVEIEDSDDDHDEGGIAVDVKNTMVQEVTQENEFVEGEELKPYDEVEADDKEFSTKGQHGQRYHLLIGVTIY